MKTKLALITFLAAAALPALAQAADIDWNKVDAALGKSAAVSGDVHRYGLPRSDLKVTLDGVTIKPALALGGWVAFAPMGGEAMLMGDLVLLEWRRLPVRRAATRPDHRNGAQGHRTDGRRQRHQFPAHRERQGRDHRRLSGHGRRGQSADPRLACQ